MMGRREKILGNRGDFTQKILKKSERGTPISAQIDLGRFRHHPYNPS
jgi:hypothetical protein